MIIHLSSVKMDISTYKTVFKLFKEFVSSQASTCSEFIEEKCLHQGLNVKPSVLEFFVSLVNNKKLLFSLTDNFIAKFKIPNCDKLKISMFMFYLTLASNKFSFDDICGPVKALKFSLKCEVLDYFSEENNFLNVALIACEFYDDEYVLKYLVPVLENLDNFRKLSEEMKGDGKRRRRSMKLPTIPDHLTVLNRPKKQPIVPLNTPRQSRIFVARPIPRTLYLEEDKVEQRLASQFEKNRLKAQRLLETAKSLTIRYKKKSNKLLIEETPPLQFKARKAPPPPKQDVTIRENLTTVLREAKTVMKEQEEEIKNIETILQGGQTLEKYRELEEAAQREEQRRVIEDIQRKHIEGLLTFEESILAKKKLLDCKKQRFKRFMEERDEFLRKMEQWRDEEEAKMRLCVQKGHEIEHNARQSELRMKQEKQNYANKVKDESKELLQKMYEKNYAELLKKSKLIEEIKSLHQLKLLNNTSSKEVDAGGEGANVGLLCQMSIAELQERLAMAKKVTEERLEQKRQCIIACKEKRRQMVENVKNFIAQSRMSKPKSVPIRPTELERSPDLDKLRSQLEYARELRKTNLT